MGKSKNFSEEIKQKVIDNYVIKKQGLQTCGKEYGVSQYMVEKILKEAGIRKRTYTEAKQEGRKYSCNDDFFKVQSHNMAYILGLIASDGNISKRENLITIELLTRDKEILEKIRQETESTRPIKDYIKSTTKQETSKFCVWSKKWKDDLKIYNIVPNKTFILEPPTFLKAEYRIDFIRGYFDGDGSVYKVSNRNNVNFQISGASKPMIEWIREVLANDYGITTKMINKEKVSECYTMYKITYCTIEIIKRIYNLLYNENDILYMKRKKEKFTELLKILPRDSNTLEKV